MAGLLDHDSCYASATTCPSRGSVRPHAAVILVAEDNPINQRIILAQLDLLGFRAEVA